MKVRWSRTYTAVHPALGLTTRPGEVIDVPSDVAKQLLTQPDSWEKPTKSKIADGEEGDD